jgi:hypothetical protein
MRRIGARLLLVCLLGLGATAGCPGSRQPTKRRAIKPPDATHPEPFPADMADDVRQYLLAVHKELHKAWAVDVLYQAAVHLPAEDPANNKDLVVQLTIDIDADGQPGAVRMVSASSHQPFNKSAVFALSTLKGKKLPPLPPSVGEGSGLLHWSFHRDRRSCSPAFARLKIHGLGPADTLFRALKRQDHDKARQIVEQNRSDPRVASTLVSAGLAAGSAAVRLAALELAQTQRLTNMLQMDRHPKLRKKAFKVLVQRKETAALKSLFGLAEPQSLAKQGSSTPLWAEDWLVDLLWALKSLELQVDSAKIERFLHDQRPMVALSAVPLVRKPEPLKRAIAVWQSEPRVSGPLAVRWRALKESSTAEELIRSALQGPGQMHTLEALRWYPLPSMASEVAKLALKGATPTVRVKAIQVLGKLGQPSAALLRSLAHKEDTVRIAAARALGGITAGKEKAARQLRRMARKETGAVAAEALAALAMLGVDNHRDYVLGRMDKLDLKGRTLVTAALWGFGEAAVPALAELVKGESPPLARAATESLSRIPGSAAKLVLKGARATPEEAAPAEANQEPLVQLIRLVLAARPR